jgi:hypothetical protein
MPSFLSNFPIFYEFFSTKTGISTKTSKNVEFNFLLIFLTPFLTQIFPKTSMF